MNPDKLCEAIKHYCHIDVRKEIAFDGNIMSDYGVYNYDVHMHRQHLYSD